MPHRYQVIFFFLTANSLTEMLLHLLEDPKRGSSGGFYSRALIRLTGVRYDVMWFESSSWAGSAIVTIFFLFDLSAVVIPDSFLLYRWSQ